MDEWEMLENDIKLLKKAISISKDIGICYRNLILGDLMGLKNSDIYNCELEKIEAYRSEENKIYNKLKIDDQKLRIVEAFLSPFADIHDKKVYNNFSSICHEPVENLWFNRVYTKLYLNNYEINASRYYSLKKSYELDNNKCPLTSLQNQIYEQTLRDEMTLSYIFFLNEEINNTDDLSLKQYFKSLYYNFCYLSPLLEDKLIRKVSSNQHELCFSFDMVGDLLNIPQDERMFTVESDVFDSCRDTIDKICLMLDLEKDDTIYLQRAYSLNIRAGLSLLYNNPNATSIISELEFLTLEYQESNIDKSDLLEDLIYAYLDSSNQDKSKCKYLSMKKPK